MQELHHKTEVSDIVVSMLMLVIGKATFEEVLKPTANAGAVELNGWRA